MSIISIKAAQRLDSRGKPTIQVRLATTQGTFQAIVPSGASKGDYEAVELRDGDKSRFQGNSVLNAVRNIEDVIAPALHGSDLQGKEALKDLDNAMIKLDGTEDKSKLGANAILGVSMAAARACAATQNLPLYDFIAKEARMPTDQYIMPVPFFNVLNGGDHSGNSMAFQEFMLAPVGASSFTEAVQFGAEIYSCLKTVIAKKHGKSAVGIGDEGGFAPPIYHPHEALDLLNEAISQAGHDGKVKIGIDPASQSFYEAGKYNLGFKTSSSELLGYNDLTKLYHLLIERYPIVLLEDPFGQDDWGSWTEFNKNCNIELVGDDLLATNIKRINIASEKHACNSMLLKINQIGTISESLAAAAKAYSLGWSVFVSHRSGESTDDFIADLVVGVRAGHLKSGAPCRGERVVKYNRLMDIEDEINARGVGCSYAGSQFGVAQKM